MVDLIARSFSGKSVKSYYVFKMYYFLPNWYQCKAFQAELITENGETLCSGFCCKIDLVLPYIVAPKSLVERRTLAVAKLEEVKGF